MSNMSTVGGFCFVFFFSLFFVFPKKGEPFTPAALRQSQEVVLIPRVVRIETITNLERV